MPALTQTLREEYKNLFDSCVIRPERKNEIETIISRLLDNRSRYEAVSDQVDVPWYIIGVIHSLEASQSFKKHLHNGDPLTARTVQVPKNRPTSGAPPFTWEDSAMDALTFDGFDRVEDWSLPGALFNLERFNGFGSRNKGINTPYLWSFSKHYTKGKFVHDGIFDPNAVSNQCGAAILLRRLVDNDAIEIPPAIGPSTKEEIIAAGADVPFSNQKSVKATRLQKLLNRFPGISTQLVPDGSPGNKTSAAFKEVTGNFLAGDPRAV